MAARLGIPHVSTGEMFRYHVSTGTELGRRVDAIMATGEYVPDSITVEMLAQRIGAPDARNGFILDGFPRTLPQVEALDELLGAQGLDGVVLFVVDEDELASRLLERGRADDSIETIRNRFQVYRAQTEPILELYNERDLVIEVDGMGDVDEVTDRLLDVIAGSQVSSAAGNPESSQ